MTYLICGLVLLLIIVIFMSEDLLAKIIKYFFYFVGILILGSILLISLVDDRLFQRYEYHRLNKQTDDFVIRMLLQGKEKKINRLTSVRRNPYTLSIWIDSRHNKSGKLIKVKKVSLNDTINDSTIDLLKYKHYRDDEDSRYYIRYRDINIEHYNPQKVKIEFSFEDEPLKVYYYEGILEKDYEEEIITS